MPCASARWHRSYSKNMNTISIPTNDRLPLLQKCLAALRAAMGIERWTLCFSCEPCDGALALIKAIDWAPVYVSCNTVKMGCWVNTFLAANFAMTVGSKLNLYVEDDIVVSPDALSLTEQFSASRYEVLALRRPDTTVRPFPKEVARFQGGLFGDGFAWRSHTWLPIRAGWFAMAGKRGFSMWDWSMEYALSGITQARPLMHRSQNIGLQGTHQQGYDPNRHSPCYAGPPVDHFNFS